jgi:hypothetical protein
LTNGVATRRSAEHGVARVADGARLQLDQLQHVPAVQGQLGDAFLVNQRRDASFLGVDERGLRRDAHGFAERANGHREVEPHRFADRQDDVRLRDGFEPF